MSNINTKNVVLIALVLGVINVQCKPTKVDSKLSLYNKECKQSTAVDEKLIDAAKEGKFSDKIEFKSFVYCVLKKVGVQNITGEIEKLMAIENLIEILGDKDLAADLVEKCAKHRVGPEDTALETIKCIYEGNPQHKLVFIE